MLNTKDMSVGTGKTKPVINVGNHLVKINDITLETTAYDATASNLVLHVETKPIGGDFEGFLKNPDNPNGPRYEGQVGKVKFSMYHYKDTVLPTGTRIEKDAEILKSLILLSETLGKRQELDNIEATNIEDFVRSAARILSGNAYINACIGGREWKNKDGYINYDLFLPKFSKDGIPLEASNVEVSRLLLFNKADHVKPLVEKQPQPSVAFENTQKGDDFEI